MRAQAPRRLEAVEFRHLNVHQDQIVAHRTRHAHGLETVAAQIDAATEPAEHLRCDTLVDGVVLGYQHV